jgi:hypothetical protein
MAAEATLAGSERRTRGGGRDREDWRCRLRSEKNRMIIKENAM